MTTIIAKIYSKDELEMRTCPFCGGVANLIAYEDFPDCGVPDKYFNVVCNTPDCYASDCVDSGYYETPEDAANAWNKRAN